MPPRRGGDGAPPRSGHGATSRHLVKRSVRLAGHPTSIALEPAFWAALDAEAARRHTSLAALVAEQDALRAETGEPLTSRLRVFALEMAQRGGA